MGDRRGHPRIVVRGERVSWARGAQPVGAVTYTDMVSGLLRGPVSSRLAQAAMTKLVAARDGLLAFESNQGEAGRECRQTQHGRGT
jgi:hypothetical protein